MIFIVDRGKSGIAQPAKTTLRSKKFHFNACLASELDLTVGTAKETPQDKCAVKLWQVLGWGGKPNF